MNLKLILAILLLTVVIVPTPAFAVEPRKMATSTAELLRQKAVVTKINGTVSAIGATSITVGNTVVNVSATTRLLRKYGALAKLSEFTVGDQVMVRGNVIRDLSIQKRRGVFVGNVTALTGTGFVLTPEKRPAQTVGVNLLTKYVDHGEKTISLSALKVGDKVMVKGLWDNKLNTITEVTFVRDYSLPLKAPKTATNSGEAR